MMIFLHSKFSFERLPSPLRANSQKAALKLISASRKLQNLMRVLSYDEVTLVTGLTAEKIRKIIAKSDIIEQKLLEGMVTEIATYPKNPSRSSKIIFSPQ